MSAPWYVVKYMPDLYRREPRNIGVVLLHDDHGYGRFLGQDPASGELDTRRVAQTIPATKTYAAWVDFFTHHLTVGTWTKARESLARRSLDNFLVEEGGTWELDYDDPRLLLDELYGSLVDDLAASTGDRDSAGSPSIMGLIRRVFQEAGIAKRVVSSPIFHVPVQGLREPIEKMMKFDYKFANGHVTLMERMSLAPGRDTDNQQRINDFLYRAEHVSEQHPEIENFIALYHVTGRPAGEGHDEVEEELRQLEAYADTLDVSNVPAAATGLRENLSLDS